MNKEIYTIFFSISFSLLSCLASFRIKIIFRLFYNLRQMSEVRWWHNFYHLIVETVLLWLNLLDWIFKEPNFINLRQGTFIIIIILFFPELSFIFAFISILIFVLFIFIIIILMPLIFTILIFIFIDSLFSIFSYHFY